MFGEDKVKLLCGNLLSEEIQDECEKTGMMFVGRGRITQFNEDTFTAGKPHNIEVHGTHTLWFVILLTSSVMLTMHSHPLNNTPSHPLNAHPLKANSFSPSHTLAPSLPLTDNRLNATCGLRFHTGMATRAW